MGNEIVPFKQKLNTFRELLEKMKPQIAAALPEHVKPDRVMRIVLTTIQRTPKLLECSQSSVLGAIVQSAQLGLECDGILGEAYLVPYKDTCQLIVGYKGLLKLVRQSGQISSICARVVHQKDKFAYSFGLQDKLTHVPSQEPEPGPVTHVYMVARLKDGGVHFDIMSAREIEAIRKRSRAGQSGPWVTDWDEMAKKTVIRRGSKLLPASVELARAIAIDEQADANLAQAFETPIELDQLPPADAGGPPRTLDEIADKQPALAAKPDVMPKAQQLQNEPMKMRRARAAEAGPEDRGDEPGPGEMPEPGSDG